MPRLSTAALLGVGVALVVLAALAVWGPRGVHTPEGSGDTGVVLAYGQTPAGPVRLLPDQPRALSRPQDFAFQFTCDGTGPRVVRLELEYGDHKELLHEELLRGPLEMEALEYVLHLDDRAPNEVTLVTTVEAPHTRTRVVRYPVRLGR